jgi:hexosaminidase
MMLDMKALALFVLLNAAVSTKAYQLLPTVDFEPGNASTGFDFTSASKVIYIDDDFADVKDSDGLTLIPPSAYEFADTFRQDLEQASGVNWTLQRGSVSTGNANGILLGRIRVPSENLAYENGSPTTEAYEVDISNGSIYIGGSGSRGMWWGTRTLLQLLILNGTALPSGRIVDAPAYATRGFMLDAGRKWYAPSFLKELCSYASFFKMSEFHYHSSDNYPLTRGHNETWSEVYSQFSLLPESAELAKIVQRKNETLSRAQFEDFQTHCAQRGVTVIPEIEAPGHCLSITKWKPELALSPNDLLNLTHPDAIPTVKSIWDEFLPWFQTKEVHIGADEYLAALADDYIRFVNEMSDYINSTSQKRIRIWGTAEPSKNLSISKNVIVQHWQYGQSDPVELQATGYDFVNSEDWWAYMSLKNDHMPILPAPYPQFFNETRTLNFGGQPGLQWNPALFNPVNLTMQLESTASGNKGAILAAWNDNGPDATTQLEAYYAVRRGIPLVAARAWAGSRGPAVDTAALDPTIDFLSPKAPAQNLDRQISNGGNSSDPLLVWKRQSSTDAEPVTLGYGSKGMNYSLSLSVTAPFNLSSDDATLSLSSDGTLLFNSDGWDYPLRSTSEKDGFDPGQPGRIWVNATSSSHVPVNLSLPVDIMINTDVLGGSRVWANGTFVGRFEVFVFGGKNTQFSWSQMAFVAPLQTLSGGIENLTLRETVSSPSSPNLPTPPAIPNVARLGQSISFVLCLVALFCGAVNW